MCPWVASRVVGDSQWDGGTTGRGVFCSARTRACVWHRTTRSLRGPAIPSMQASSSGPSHPSLSGLPRNPAAPTPLHNHPASVLIITPAALHNHPAPVLTIPALHRRAEAEQEREGEPGGVGPPLPDPCEAREHGGLDPDPPFSPPGSAAYTPGSSIHLLGVAHCSHPMNTQARTHLWREPPSP